MRTISDLDPETFLKTLTVSSQQSASYSFLQMLTLAKDQGQSFLLCVWYVKQLSTVVYIGRSFIISSSAVVFKLSGTVMLGDFKLQTCRTFGFSQYGLTKL